ncbi:hypothetical protein SFMTTN_0496 [Sulfuriferula multivorans]|uniref:Uncharacterized protein n=1 Tax=Sulfuriferula multivorans TaxID=1559896 RepID=A0A401JAJ3_9PROT|nr:hypothetical protein [Sulfuriferula multivorans]GBL44695.1 hypothetical protein SFMTTN_0496 [Sulfuriferula multivorans]
MSKYSELIRVLRDCSDHSKSDLKILSKDIQEHIAILDKFNIKYEIQAEGVSIDLSDQPVKIYKSKESAVKYLRESDFSSDILVVEADASNPECQDIEFVAMDDPQSCSRLFDNLEYYFKFKKLFLDKDIASYNDEALNRLIFLSNKHGRLHITSNNEWVEEFYDSDNDLKKQYQEIKRKIDANKDYEDFFKESLIEYAKAIPEENLRFVKVLKNIKHIIESSNRNFELYKHNFSFAEFKKELDEDKDKYLKDYQSSLSDFLSKIASMPIQFGAYIFLMVRFGDELLPISATVILIFVWSYFNVMTVNRILENVEYLKLKFKNDLDALIKKSGIDKAEVESDENEVVERFCKTIYLIKGYRLFVIIFTICALAICAQFIFTM